MKVLTLSPDTLKHLPANPEPGVVYNNLHDGFDYVYDGQLRKWMQIYDEPQNEEVE